MRLLHTADWHLGRTLHGASLLDAQLTSIGAIAEIAADEGADAILLAGDVFDRALPPRDVVELWDEAMTRLAEICPLVVISGNHDSAVRLGVGARLLDRSGVHIRVDPAGCGAPVVIGDCCVYPIPYLEPDLVRDFLGAVSRGHEAVLAAAMDRVRADLAGRPARTRSVVVAHAFVTGAETAPSERDLSVGGSASVPGSVFAGVDHVALGHLHGPQKVAGIGRYAGSPLAFSFAERHQKKSVSLIELDGSGTHTRTIELPVPRPLATLTGTLDELLTDAENTVHEGSWVSAVLTDAVHPLDAMARLQSRFPHALHLEHRPEGAAPTPAGAFSERIAGVADIDLLLGFVEDMRGAPAADDEAELLDLALSAARSREVAA
ncbi:MAG: exonuclease SbcCD subunit D [Baekduia sp.]